MLPLLMWVPVMTSFVLGVVYLVLGEGGPVLKLTVCIVFVVAAYLQFSSPYPIGGLVMQAGLALALAIWRKLAATT